MNQPSGLGSPHEFDVAFSFAGEDREFVEEIVVQLKAEDMRVFYDSDYSTEMWGEDLIEYLDTIYRTKARYAVIFISKFYAAKMWTNHERRSILTRALEDPNTYMLPVRLDDEKLPGLRPTIGYLDARQEGLAGIVAAILAKLGSARTIQKSRITRVPRTEVERQQLLLDRPPGWEYLYLAAQVLHERDAIEDKYRDYRMGYAPPTGEVASSARGAAYLGSSADRFSRFAQNLNRVMSRDAQEHAIGAPGQAGDPEAIAHLAKRWNNIYEGLMDATTKLRGASIPDEFDRAVELLASFNDSPISAYRQFVDDLVAQNDRLPDLIAAGEPVKIEMTLTFTIEDEKVKAFSAELDRIRRTQLQTADHMFR